MNHRTKRWMVAGWMVLLGLALVACGGSTPALPSTTDSYEDMSNVDEIGNTTIYQAALGSTLDQIPTATLSDAEVEGLLYMREEEKLARDVYLALYEEWGLPIFQNIANSEQTHTDAVKVLLDRYDLQDPMAEASAGIFTNSTLQNLYDQLVVEGSQSLANALSVGAAIEEIDILDLEEWIAQTDKADIQTVYENLMKGSGNHLRSFVSTLERQAGETYQHQYLSQEVYDGIANTQVESGRRGRPQS